MVELLVHLLVACTLRSVMGVARSINDTLRVSPGGDLLGGIFFSPDGSNLYVTNSTSFNQSLTAVGVKDGKVAWTYHGDELNNMAMSPDGSAVYCGSADKGLHALDARSGKVLWTFSTGNNTTTGGGYPAVSPDSKVVYARGLPTTAAPSASILYALNATNGSERWRAGTDAWYAHPLVISLDGSALYATTSGTQLHASSAQDGSLLWKVDLPGADARYAGQNYVSLSPDGTVVYVVVSSGQAICAFDASSGALLWNVPLHGFHLSPAAAASSPDGSVVVVTNLISSLYKDLPKHDSVHALYSSGGEKAWSATVGPGVSNSAAFSPDGSVVFVGGENGVLYALDDGIVLWSGSTTNVPVSVGPIVSPDGKSVVVGAGGSIFIFPTEVTRRTRTRSLRSSQA